MGTIADKLQKLLDTKEAIRQAIIAKGQAAAEADTFASYADKIRAIQTGIDTSDATAAAGDILSGKTAYGPNGKITGTIASKGESNLTASGATVSVPAGYYPSAVSKSVTAATQATPSISVSTSGLITASATQTAGYVAAGTKSATSQLTTQAAATITPGTAAKTAVASGRYTTGAVTVAGSSNLVAGNIKSGVNIFGVTGSYAGNTISTAIVTVVNSSSYTRSILYTTVSGDTLTSFRGSLSSNTSANFIVASGSLLGVEWSGSTPSSSGGIAGLGLYQGLSMCTVSSSGTITIY